MKNLLFTSICCFITLNVFSQGCSDAGICSFTNSSQKLDSIHSKNILDVGLIVGQGIEGVIYFSSTINYTRVLNSRLSLSSKVIYNQANGDFGTRGQFGDIFLLGSYKLSKNTNRFNTNFGLKVPFNNANLKINGIPLPMDYQSSLGTLDALVGINYNFNKWNFDTALQIPVINLNRNSYFDEYSLANDFPSTNLFERKSDALFRTTYQIDLNSKKWVFKPNLLFIYHLGEDTYEDIFGNRKSIPNSDGLTINANLISIYKVFKNQYIESSIASPIVVREIRPDGLTRALTFSLNYKIYF